MLRARLAGLIIWIVTANGNDRRLARAGRGQAAVPDARSSKQVLTVAVSLHWLPGPSPHLVT